MGAGGGREGASQVTPNVYNRFQNAVMAQQEAAGARTEGMMGRDSYMNAAPLDQAVATAGQQRAGMMGPDVQDPSIPGRMENAFVENTASNNAGMLGDIELIERLRAEENERKAMRGGGMEMGPGRSRRNVMQDDKRDRQRAGSRRPRRGRGRRG